MRRLGGAGVVLSLATVAVLLSGRGSGQEVYEKGGPLAGLVLPPYPTQHGEPPGHPGSIPGTPFAACRRGMQYELYPGSVEHWSEYWMKYVPARSLFDRQSQRRNWRAADGIPGAEGVPLEEYASPVYHIPDNAEPQDTGRRERPVKAIRCREGAPVFRLDLGELDPGVYVIRVIGAVETSRLRPFRLPLYVAMSVNDGLDGEVSTYRRRCNYVDEFYSVAETYFHAPSRRRYEARVWLDRGTQVELLVHNISLDDVLAGIERRAIKRRQVLVDDGVVRAAKGAFEEQAGAQRALAQFAFDPETRLARDEMIWRYYPPVNAQGHTAYRQRGATRVAKGVTLGLHGLTEEQIEAEHGAWSEAPILRRGLLGNGPAFAPAPADPRGFIENRKLGLAYTVDDLAAGRPLPAPYPFKDDGAGLFEPDPDDPARGQFFGPIARGVGERWRTSVLTIDNLARLWLATRNRDVAHDGAVALVRYAYALPTLDSSQYLTYTATSGVFGVKDCVRFREMRDYWLHHYENFHMAAIAYDYLFDYIQGNEQLARSIGRFVPWVRTPDDVVALLDSYLVQFTAKKVMRFHFNRGQRFPVAVAVLDDPALAQQWGEFLFSRVFQYPYNPAGIQDLLASAYSRTGTNTEGSAFYSQRGGARTVLEDMLPYLKTVAGTKYDLRDPVLYPKPMAHCHWRLDAQVGGLDLLRIGDVRGPDKAPGRAEVEKLIEAARSGWAWSGDPRFAWVLVHVAGRGAESDEEWDRLERAALQVPRAPWLDNRSRFLANWAGILETGLEHDDYRFRRAVYVRTGLGQGHEHADTLDLQVFAHGLPMTIDDGQRSGYCKPNSRLALVHNIVEIDTGTRDGGLGHIAHGWAAELSDAPGARYMKCRAISPIGPDHVFERQTALIDVDEGEGSRRLSVREQLPGAALPRDARTANSYVFDVFRAEGGRVQTYLFHAMVNDDLQTNARDMQPVAHLTAAEARERAAREPGDEAEEEAPNEPQQRPVAMPSPRNEAEYLAPFTESADRKFAGVAPEVLEATWRYTRDGRVGSEQRMLGVNYDGASPRKFTRLHLFGRAGDRVLQADGACIYPPIPYRYSALMVQRRQANDGAPLSGAWPAIVEPFVGEPFILERQLLAIPDHEDDALRAVAIEVTTRNGHRDLCFADGRPDRTRRFGPFTVSGAFAYHSTDGQGLRACALTGGTVVESPEVSLRLPHPERTARITAVDYRARTVSIDQPWPSACGARIFEVGGPGRWTAFTAVSAVADGDGAVITLKETAELLRSEIVAVDRNAGTVRVALQANAPKGFQQGLSATTDDLGKSWRVNRVDSDTWQTIPDRALPEAVQVGAAMRLWEYGVGDTVRMASYAGLRRVAPGTYELCADSPVALRLIGRIVETSQEGQHWQPHSGVVRGEVVEVQLDPSANAGGILFARVK